MKRITWKPMPISLGHTNSLSATAKAMSSSETIFRPMNKSGSNEAASDSINVGVLNDHFSCNSAATHLSPPCGARFQRPVFPVTYFSIGSRLIMCRHDVSRGLKTTGAVIHCEVNSIYPSRVFRQNRFPIPYATEWVFVCLPGCISLSMCETRGGRQWHECSFSPSLQKSYWSGKQVDSHVFTISLSLSRQFWSSLTVFSVWLCVATLI